ncbi:TPA: Dr family adhesin structural subunit [Escherichia coli]
MNKQITYILAAASLGLACSAHAGFQPIKANNGTINTAVVEFTAINNCVVTLTASAPKLISNQATDGELLGSLSVTSTGCAADQVAVKPNPENWEGGYHTFLNDQAVDAKVTATFEGSGWSEDSNDGTIYRDIAGDGPFDDIVFKLKGNVPESGKYKVTFTAGTWTQ